MAVIASTDPFKWWSELKHGGMLISPPVLEEYFPNESNITPSTYRVLRDNYTTFLSWFEQTQDLAKGETYRIHRWLDVVLEKLLGHNEQLWLKGTNIDDKYTVETPLKEKIRPHRILFTDKEQKDPQLFVYIDKSKRIGLGKGKHNYSKLLELLRVSGVKMGLITNGIQFRLCYAGVDHESWVEWDATTWFEEGELRYQLNGLLTLLGSMGMKPRENFKYPLLKAVEESRTRQSELSSVLGEQVREAIELVLNQTYISLKKNPDLATKLNLVTSSSETLNSDSLNAIYQASSRIIMRLVVVLFAEARGLLPRDISTYNESYSLEGVYEKLKNALIYEGAYTLTQRGNSWLRIISLFRVISKGSFHPNLPIRAYGGLLFKEGELNQEDLVLNIIHLIESEYFEISDFTVYQILEKLKIGKLKVKRGRSTAWVKGPVDFSELRTEYIGMMYEGLLDYQLKSATEPIVFLNLGNEPALPLNTLESMSNTDIKNLFEKVKSESSDNNSDSDDMEVDHQNSPFSVDKEEVFDMEEQEEVHFTRDEESLLQERALIWAKKAVEISGMIKKTKKNTERYIYEQKLEKIASNIVKQVLTDDEFYLIRWGGNRKGSGTFYTKPGLSIPTVNKTLQPLLYENDKAGNLIPRLPEEILSVKVCDPSCGSASFLVAALNYTTEALFRSMMYFSRYKKKGSKNTILLPFGTKVKGHLQEDIVKVTPEDERFEEVVKSQLKRYVVERCIFGVDINPMAVELAKLSLWIETMDRELPFTFLDHKIKVGNALVGCWFNNFMDYPILAWSRDGGDSSHTNGINYKKEEWSKNIKKALQEKIKPEIVDYIESLNGQSKLFETAEDSGKDILAHILTVFNEIHDTALSAEGIRQREKLYKEKIVHNSTFQTLKNAFDTWCSLWFWPADQLDDAPTPSSFLDPAEKTVNIVKKLANKYKFFHWELEFPDVFTSQNSGFNSIIGNPPWDVSKPNSKEFFSNFDPLYRTYGKQEAIRKQKDYFKNDKNIERDWLLYQAEFKAMSNWITNVAFPYGDGQFPGSQKLNLMQKGGQWRKSDSLHKAWSLFRENRLGFVDSRHPFRYQGSADLNKYKLFVEASHSLLNEKGRLGMIVPSSIYTDKGSSDLRKLFLDNSNWELIFSFENKNKIFKIHSSYKFCILIINKYGKTGEIKTSFMNHDLSDLEKHINDTMPYSRNQLQRFSPNSLALLEFRNNKDLDIAEKIYSNSVLLSDGGEHWKIKYQSEFHMTSKSNLFFNLKYVENHGYENDIYGRWINNNESSIMLPLYQGVMINQFDFSTKEWLSGTGLNAVWEENSWEQKRIKPQFLIKEDNYLEEIEETGGIKVCFRDIARNTDTRTMIASIIGDFPCGNPVPVLRLEGNNIFKYLFLAANLNSFCYDFVIRHRCGGTHLNYFVISESPLLKFENISEQIIHKICSSVASLNMAHNLFAPYWLGLKKNISGLSSKPWKQHWALTSHERTRLRCVIDAIIAELYGLTYQDFAWILRNDLSDPKGFWRVDKDKPQEFRQTTLTLEAFKRVKNVGLEAFCKEDWQLPSYVAQELGKRFLPSQLKLSIEESWEECEKHAINIQEENKMNEMVQFNEKESLVADKKESYQIKFDF
ncbi:hypothetical protein J2S74_004970 [Evansella vedderi]|uniref:site-specific DNA-methyltransferase (adenine-specific) n=1 Tax=Evansella vedderi TaxID=38282 RepID=A0ABU0A207_9BACI|nr:hypothetical protein [Evansella vedderi]MDQ0257512.1 hypothetical protein [Evansella vedderi]